MVYYLNAGYIIPAAHNHTIVQHFYMNLPRNVFYVLNEHEKDLKSMKKEVNWIENQGEN